MESQACSSVPLKRGTQSDCPTDDKDVHQPSVKPRTWVGVKNTPLFLQSDWKSSWKGEKENERER